GLDAARAPRVAARPLVPHAPHRPHDRLRSAVPLEAAGPAHARGLRARAQPRGARARAARGPPADLARPHVQGGRGSKPSFRVYFVVYEDGRCMGKLMRTWDGFFDRPAPAAYGATAEDVYAELETKLEAIRRDDPSDIERYLWDERFETLTVPVEIH